MDPAPARKRDVHMPQSMEDYKYIPLQIKIPTSYNEFGTRRSTSNFSARSSRPYDYICHDNSEIRKRPSEAFQQRGID